MRPQTWSKTFFARKPAIRPSMMLKGVKRIRDTKRSIAASARGGIRTRKPRRAGVFKTPAYHQFRHPGTRILGPRAEHEYRNLAAATVSPLADPGPRNSAWKLPHFDIQRG